MIQSICPNCKRVTCEGCEETKEKPFTGYERNYVKKEPQKKPEDYIAECRRILTRVIGD